MDQKEWESLEPLLDEALELPPGERASWLDRLRSRSAALADAVEALLAREAEADREAFLEGGLRVTLAGQQLGAWTLERPLGQGGMGTVWLARRTDGRYEGMAAVKLLNLALVTPAGLRRFRREGSTLSLLAHPNIARLLDAGVSPAGQPYLILEYVDGQPVDAWAAARGLGLRERLQLFQQVLGAVGHAHAHLVVHRDLKPGNILVTADGRVQLLDFGIAKLLDTEGADLETRTSIRALTPMFAAPEQLSGDQITTATDIYALGVLLYLLVSGRHPTAGDARTPADAVRRALEIEPAPLHLGDLDTVLAKALRKSAAERYQTVAALSEDLTHYLNHEPVSARAPSWNYRSARFLRRHRAGVVAAALAAATLVGATVYSTSQRAEAIRQRDAARDERHRADAQVEFQDLLLSEVGDKPVTMRQLLDRGRGVLERQAIGDPKLMVTVLLQLAENYGELGDLPVGDTLLARADSFAQVSGDPGARGRVHCRRADHLRQQGRYADAWREMDQADSLMRNLARSTDRVGCLVIRSHLAEESGLHTDLALASTQEALAILDSLGDTDNMLYVSVLGEVSSGLSVEGRHREAMAALRRTMALMDSTGRGGMLPRIIYQHNLGTILAELGETAAAETVFHDVLVRSAGADPENGAPAQPLIHYAETALYQGHADSAAKYFAELLQGASRDSNAYWQCRALFGLARAQIRLGRLRDARASAARFRRLFRANFKRLNTDDQVADPGVLDGWLALADGRVAAAHDLLDSVLTSYGWQENRYVKLLRADALLIAAADLKLDNLDEALALARKSDSSAVLDSLAEYRSAYVGEARAEIARILLAQGDSAGARARLEEARAALRTGAGPEHPLTRETEDLLVELGQ